MRTWKLTTPWWFLLPAVVAALALAVFSVGTARVAAQSCSFTQIGTLSSSWGQSSIWSSSDCLFQSTRWKAYEFRLRTTQTVSIELKSGDRIPRVLLFDEQGNFHGQDPDNDRDGVAGIDRALEEGKYRVWATTVDQGNGSFELSISAPPQSQRVSLDDASIRQQIAERYAPVLRFHQGERYLPVSVNAMTDHAKLMYNQPAPNIDVTLLESISSPSILFNGFDDNTYLDLKQGFGVDSSAFDSWWSGVKHLYPNAVYARVASGNEFGWHSSFTTLVQYWFFYVFNDGWSNHEGDWEGIQLIFNVPIEDVLDGAAPIYMFYTHHNEGTWWLDCEGRWTGRPNVFVAKGSHASYRLANEYPIAFGTDDDALGNGMVLWPSQYDVILLESQTWPDWPGRWGSLGAANFSTGPPGPKFNGEEGRRRWEQPASIGYVEHCE